MKKKFVIDFILNFISTIVPIAVLQLFVLPKVGVALGDIKFGLAVSIISLTTMLSVPIGNVLNNVRLLSNERYKEENLTGDFNLILIYGLVLNFLVVSILGFYYSKSIIDTVLIIIMATLITSRYYFNVGFRLKLSFKNILIENLLLSIGYIIGVLLLIKFGIKWQIIYILGNFISITFVLRKTKLLNEGFGKTKLYKKNIKQTITLFMSVFMKSTIDYADKLIILPLMDAASVSVYYSSSIASKILSLLFASLSNVILSYIVRVKKLKKSLLNRIVIILFILSIIAYVIIYNLSIPILEFLYPEWAALSIKLIPITTATAIVASVISVLNPFIMKFRTFNWQVILNGSTLLIYIILILVLQNILGLTGVALGVLLSNIYKLLFMLILLYFSKDISGDE